MQASLCTKFLRGRLLSPWEAEGVRVGGIGGGVGRIAKGERHFLGDEYREAVGCLMAPRG